MKAAVYYETGEPDVLRYEDVPDPTCGAGGVLVEGRGDQHRGRRHAQPRRRRDALDARTSSATSAQARCIEVGAGVDDRSSVGDASSPSVSGSHAELLAVPGVVRVAGSRGLADATTAACVPVAFGTADDCLFEFGRLQAGRDGADPGRRGRRRARGDPDGQAGRGHGARHRVERRQARAAHASSGSTTASTTPTATGSPRSAPADRRAAGVDLVVDSVGGADSAWKRAVPGVPRAVRHGRQRRPRAADAVRHLVHARRATSRSRACSSAPRSRRPRAHAMIARHVDDVAAGELAGRRSTGPSRSRRPPAAHAYIESRQAFGRVVLLTP